MSEEIKIAKQWLAKARNDLLNADNNLKADHIPFDTVCFHCQQAGEKLLKAYLVGNNHSYPLTQNFFSNFRKNPAIGQRRRKSKRFIGDTYAIRSRNSLS
jgi:HEPN domain-containing protein